MLAVVTVLLCGCSNAQNADNGKLKIITTIFPQYDFARNIGGEAVEVKMLLPFGSESHDYEPSLSDIAAIEACDLFIYVGGETDKWAENILEGIDVNKIALIDTVQTLEIEEHDESENEHNHKNCEIDEHVWTSPKNAIVISQAISDKLCQIDSNNAELYKNNLSAYLQRLKALDESLTETVKNADNKTLIFSERFPFRYLTNDYGLSYYSAFNGCSSDTEPTLLTVSSLINKINELNCPIIFFTEFSKETVADTICDATGAEKLLLHSCHNVSLSDFENGQDYISLMEQNIKNIGRAIR